MSSIDRWARYLDSVSARDKSIRRNNRFLIVQSYATSWCCQVCLIMIQGKIEKVPRGIRVEKSSKDMASSRNLVSTIGALASPKWGTEPGVYRCIQGRTNYVLYIKLSFCFTAYKHDKTAKRWHMEARIWRIGIKISKIKTWKWKSLTETVLKITKICQPPPQLRIIWLSPNDALSIYTKVDGLAT